MAYIKEDQILLYEELCGRTPGEDKITKATIRFRENIRLAVSIASKFPESHDGVVDKEDILQSAYEGLWRACLAYDESQENTFSTYAVPTIRGYILRQLRDNEALKMPRHYKDMRTELARHGFTVPLTDEEVDVLVQEGRFSREQILSYSEPTIMSLDYHLGDDEDSGTLSDIVADKSIKEYASELSEDEIEAIVDKILVYIKPMHRDLVEEWMYSVLAGYDLKQNVLATKYNMSQTWVSRIVKVAVRIVKMHKKEINELLGI